MFSENNHYHDLQLKSDQRGQALIEYILVVVVTVAVLIGLASQIFNPLQKFLQGYMGSYVECLLETGELPATLGGDYETAATSECRAKLDASVALLKGDGGKGDNGQGKSNKSNKDSEEGSESDSSKKDENSNSNGGADGASGYASGGTAGGGSSSRNQRGGKPQKKSLGQMGGAADDGKTQSISLNESSSGSGGGGYRIRRIRNGGRRIIPLGRLSDEEIKEIQKRNPQSGSRTSVQELGEPRVKKIPLKINNDNKSKKDEEKEMSLGIGGFLRYLLIAAIIVAILVFVGRQAFQMSKSFND